MTHQPGIGVPLRLAPSFDPKPWGGRRLESLGKRLPEGLIGESLESGPHASVLGGPFHGKTLHEIAMIAPDALLGSLGRHAAGEQLDFPLLVKLIDAHEDLSVQVHPSDRHAPEGKRGKTEAWVILETLPGSDLVIGVSEDPTRENIERVIVREPVVAGDVFLVPAGTVHAIGAGVLLYEIQQCSDITYRLYDWGRPREMHLEQGLAVTSPTSRATRIAPLALDSWRELLVACRHFALERWTLTNEMTLTGNGQTCYVGTVLSGVVRLGDEDYGHGTSFVLPADLTTTIMSGDATMLVSYVPDLEGDVFAPLRALGHEEHVIRALGTDVH